VTSVSTVALGRPAPADLAALTKPRIVGLVLATAAAGYYMAPASESPGLLSALAGTALVAAGTNALNQVAERDVDARMRRTAARPLPAGRLSPGVAALFAWALGLAGVAYLALFVNGTTAALAAATLVSYVFIYTPLKRRSSVSTLVGAVPGALPIVGGWAAAGGALDARAWALFGILYLWQLPHVLALGWLYREDYRQAGLHVLSASDRSGRETFAAAALCSVALALVSATPALLGIAGAAYLVGAALLGGCLVVASLAAAHAPSVAAARRLFTATLLYLPSLLTLMALDRVP
jgi:protoheme IX farnesyltransferase